jgi:hypothetical protein
MPENGMFTHEHVTVYPDVKRDTQDTSPEEAHQKCDTQDSRRALLKTETPHARKRTRLDIRW